VNGPYGGSVSMATMALWQQNVVSFNLIVGIGVFFTTLW